MSSSKTLLAGVVGLAAGLAIGVLFAPAKGTKTRKRLKKRIMSLADMYENEIMGNSEPLEEGPQYDTDFHEPVESDIENK